MNDSGLIKSFGLTDVGKKRRINQDSIFYDTEKGIFIIADGMGGHKAGELASKLAVEEIKNFLYTNSIILDPYKIVTDEELLKQGDIIRTAIENTNRKIFELAQSHPEYRGMGTTVVFVQIFKNKFIVAHVGDSRLYLYRTSQLIKVTKDHSRVQELIDMEQLTEEEAENYPMKNIITRALGGNRDVIVDIAFHDFFEDDLLLMCTDGLSSVLSFDEMKTLIEENIGDPESAVKKLINKVLEKGAPDNVTVLIIEGPEIASPFDSTKTLTAEELKIESTLNIKGLKKPKKKWFDKLLNKIKLKKDK